MLWNSSEFLLCVVSWQCQFLWDIVLLLLIDVDESLSRSSSGFLSRVSNNGGQRFTVSYYCSRYTPFTFYFQCFYFLFLCCIFLLAGQTPLLTMHFGKMPRGFITERKGGNTTPRFAGCAWTEYMSSEQSQQDFEWHGMIGHWLWEYLLIT